MLANDLKTESVQRKFHFPVLVFRLWYCNEGGLNALSNALVAAEAVAAAAVGVQVLMHHADGLLAVGAGVDAAVTLAGRAGGRGRAHVEGERPQALRLADLHLPDQVDQRVVGVVLVPALRAPARVRPAAAPRAYL